ncbi:uncharacterized protein N7518_007459 [Penicillium psychrosexuale]|uniref:uncharacterized protein n=1 Tax=Penicillium psychrosexuale TaxID=1002107 RepID=UPI002545891F|nr:uncharacterized protein N7518_007459 [Penicillium psychrosexuale]KAJ5790448.1 hypothetical protein N7518_007459 [Penicillium psychrosexuale]
MGTWNRGLDSAGSDGNIPKRHEILSIRIGRRMKAKRRQTRGINHHPPLRPPGFPPPLKIQRKKPTCGPDFSLLLSLRIPSYNIAKITIHTNRNQVTSQQIRHQSHPRQIRTEPHSAFESRLSRPRNAHFHRPSASRKSVSGSCLN